MDTQLAQLIADKIRQHPTNKDNEIAKCLHRHGVHAADVVAVRSGGVTATTTASASAVVNKPRVKSLADFRRAHDIPQKIRDAIAGLRVDGYVTEDELRQLCEVPVQGWRRNAELPEFAANKFRLDGVIYWAAPATIKQMKQITGKA